MLPSTDDRVANNTSEEVNRKIRHDSWQSIEQASLGGMPAIDHRLQALDREWDIERTLEANAASVSLLGCALGAFVDRRFFVLPAVVAGFLLQHALQGWCPPLPLFRRLGVRTSREIEEERAALRSVRSEIASGVGTLAH